MSKKSNQEKEQYLFNMFRGHYQLPEGKIIHGDKPDVILEGKRKIGIEITNFFLENGELPESEQQQRNVRERVVPKAQRVYRENDGKRIELSFSFDQTIPIRDQGQLVNKIAALAKNIDGFRTGLLRKDIFKDIPELSSVYLNAEEYEDPKWRIVQCYSGQSMSMERLRTIVRIKEEKSKCYKPCDAYWLVVVVDFSDRAQDQEIQITDFEKITSAIFEKVIVYKTHFGHVLQAK